MKSLTCFVFAFLSVLQVGSSAEICFNYYGCFSLDSPWWSFERPFSVLPKAPEVVNTRFLLYTKESTEETELLINKTAALQLSEFNENRPTRFIVHGFLNGGYEEWIQRMRKELINNEDCNVIVVDWKNGAKVPYMQATANTRLVGVQLAQMLQFLHSETGQSLEMMHIIGHCLGAHIAGYAGETTKQQLGRITGLDPVAPYFQGTEPKVRLDKGDAKFVDVIHTDGAGLLSLGFGIDDPLGHVDFYPNNGKEQPGCGDLDDRISGALWNLITINLIGSQQALSCSHKRAVDIFTESIATSCPFVAFVCNSWETYLEARCRRCDLAPCSRIGFYSAEYLGRGKMFLSTNMRSPYCHYSHSVELTTAISQKSAYGRIYLQLFGKSGTSEFARINNAGENIKKDTTYVMTLGSRYDIGDVKEIQVKYEDTTLFFHDKLVLKKVVASAVNKTLNLSQFTFCAHNTNVENKQTVSLKPDNTC